MSTVEYVTTRRTTVQSRKAQKAIATLPAAKADIIGEGDMVLLDAMLPRSLADQLMALIAHHNATRQNR